MFVHVRKTGGGDVGESLLLSKGARKVLLGEGDLWFVPRFLPLSSPKIAINSGETNE